MPWIDLVAAAAIVTTGAVLQGSVGFGLGIFAAPFLILIDDRLVPAPLLLASLFLTLAMARRHRTSIDFHDLKWALPGRFIGMVAGASAIALVSRDKIALMFGVVILGSVALSTSGLRLPRRPGVLVAAGTVSGFTGTTVSIGGPPIALVYQHASGPSLRGTLALYFTVGILMSLTGLYFVGRFGWSELLWGLALLPGIAVGFFISRRTAGILDRGYTRAGVLVISAMAAVAVMVRELL